MAVNEDLSRFLRNEFAKQTAALKEELAKVREEIKQVGVTTGMRLESCEERISKVEGEILVLKRSVLKNNVIISGLELDDSDLLHSVVSQLNSLLGVNLRDIEINNIYRLGRNKPVVKVEFVSFLAKSRLLNNRRKLKGSQIYLNEDLCEEDRGDFRILRQQLNLAKSKNYKTYIKSKCLFVNGEKFTVDQLKKQIDSDCLVSAEKSLNPQPARSSELTSSAPNSPAPIARYKAMLTEHEHLEIEEDSRLTKEIASINQVLHKAKDWEELGRTRSQSQSSGSVRREQRLINPGNKIKKGD